MVLAVRHQAGWTFTPKSDPSGQCCQPSFVQRVGLRLEIAHLGQRQFHPPGAVLRSMAMSRHEQSVAGRPVSTAVMSS